MPVFKLSPAIRDDLLLTLRKCLYNRKSDSRKAAVHGFLLLLRNFVCQGSSDLSASQMSQTYQFSQGKVTCKIRSLLVNIASEYCLASEYSFGYSRVSLKAMLFLLLLCHLPFLFAFVN